MEKRSDGKRLLRQTDYTLLKRVLCGDFSLICLDADDLTVLREGETAFLWESPPCASMDELISLAPLAARPNVIGLLGNHELLAAAALPSLLRAIRRGEEQSFDERGAGGWCLCLDNMEEFYV